MSFQSIRSSAGRFALANAALFLALAGASIAQAAPPVADDDVPSVTVSLAGLDLQSVAGAKTALTRIRFAAREVCGGGEPMRDLGDLLWRDACVTRAIDDAVTRVNRPALTQLRDNGRTAPARLTLGSR